MKREFKNVEKLLYQKLIYYNLHVGDTKTSSRSSSLPYLMGIRNNFCVYDINRLILGIRGALKFLFSILMSKKKILFVGAPEGFEREFFFLCQDYNHYMVDKWVCGFFTNFRRKLKSSSNQLPNVDEPLALIFIFNLAKNKVALYEAKTQDLPIMAFVNTNEDFKTIDYPIPANVGSIKGGLFSFNFFNYLFVFCRKIYSVNESKKFKKSIL